jgi:hypothetical protein
MFGLDRWRSASHDKHKHNSSRGIVGTTDSFGPVWSTLLNVSSLTTRQQRAQSQIECLMIPSALAAPSPSWPVSTFAVASALIMHPFVRPFNFRLPPRAVVRCEPAASNALVGHGCTETMCRCRCCGRSEKELGWEEGERSPLTRQNQPAPSEPMVPDPR